MADQNDTPNGEGMTQSPSIEGSGSGKTFSQEDVDRIVQERLKRAKASVPSDYEDLKAKAAKWDEQQEMGKSELERVSDELAKSNAERDALTSRLNHIEWTNSVAKRLGLPVDTVSVLRGDTEEELERSAQALVSSGVSVYGHVSDGGEPKPAPVTKDSILAIEDRAERRRQIAAHIDLFK